ncbi:Transcriptional regulatory protein LiaR [Arthrobacter sp. SO5]|uniref:helix-turn-helix transcriptional regulator n=1 Tax=Arthrobacter sp. SO5 TaxID=1897055 RepID=UPI001E5ACF39|nr:LuxR C-terminal-related transcriptional regulator [Arthrobacter sp. SO5]MCB5274215.1 Transcriptional regulatory protein LiaR [Arthrobacter sp. SO5]
MFQHDVGLPAGSGKTDAISPAQRFSQGRYDKPFTRHQIVSDVIDTLTSGSGCGVVLVGEHGAGKSFIAQRALEQLGEDYVVVQVRGSSISSKLPYGALSVLLNDLDASHLEHPLMVLRGLTQLLHTKAQGRSIVLFVDNAHDLDELSSMMVAQLSAGAHVTLLAACVDLPHVGGDIMGLWKDDLLRRVDLGPFDFTETSATLSNEYGGRFSLTAARALWNASGGNALFLHSLAREQIKIGRVVRQDGTWILGNGPIALTGEIRDVVKARLNKLSSGQRDVFELLALAGAVPLQMLMSVANPQDMDALQERAMIHVSHDHPPMVSVANQVTAGIVASVVPPGRSAELRRRLKAVLEDSDQAEFGGSTGVAWALDCGEQVSPNVALAAAHTANDSSDPVAALRFLHEIQGRESIPGVAVESVHAHISVNNDESARRVLASLDHLAGSDFSLAEWTSLQLLRTELDKRSAVSAVNARATLQTIAQRLSEECDASDVHGSDAAAAREHLRIAEIDLAVFEGRYADALTMTEDTDAGELGTESRILSASLRCEAMAVTGNIVGALDLGGQVVAAASAVQLSDRAMREIRGRFLILMLLSAKFREMSLFLSESYATADPQARLGGMFEICQGVIDVHAGLLDEALPRLRAGMGQLRTQDPDAVAALAVAACAYAAALHGDEEQASLLLAELAQLRTPCSWLVGRVTRYFELCALAELGQRALAIRSLVAEADNDTEVSALAPALLFLSAAARLGDRQVGLKLGTLSGRVSGQFASQCSRLAEGVKDTDSDQLLAASKDSDAAGNAVFARDAARKAVSFANDAGNRIALRIAQRAQQSLDDRFGSPKNGLHSLTTSTLTARECEVAVRAAAGTSNRKIAEQMHVSVRTVEGHLYQVYSKLHVASRSELKDVISTPTESARLG